MDDKPLHQITLFVMRKLQGLSKATPPEASGDVQPAVVSQRHGAMNYQLVFQFQGNSLGDFDELVALEDQLTEVLGDSADVDGHDIGAGETNIFIFTSNPARTFVAAKPVLKDSNRLEKVTAAYRDVEDEDYTVIWPICCKKKFEVL